MVDFMLLQLDAITVHCFSLPADSPPCAVTCLMQLAPRPFGACAALPSPCPSPQLVLLLVLLQPLPVPMPRLIGALIPGWTWPFLAGWGGMQGCSSYAGAGPVLLQQGWWPCPRCVIQHHWAHASFVESALQISAGCCRKTRKKLSFYVKWLEIL